MKIKTGFAFYSFVPCHTWQKLDSFVKRMVSEMYITLGGLKGFVLRIISSTTAWFINHTDAPASTGLQVTDTSSLRKMGFYQQTRQDCISCACQCDRQMI